MSELRRSLDDYLVLRRALGYKLEDVGRMLRSFVAFAEREGAAPVSTELAVRWADLPAGTTPIWRAHRLTRSVGSPVTCTRSTLPTRSRPETCWPPEVTGPVLLTCTPTPISQR